MMEQNRRAQLFPPNSSAKPTLRLPPTAVTGLLRRPPLQGAGTKEATAVRVRWEQKDDSDGSGGDAANGIVEWICEGIKAGGKLDLNLGWEVTGPKGLKWV